MKTLDKAQIEAMTMELLELLCSEDYSELWHETSIYSNDKMYTSTRHTSVVCPPEVIQIGECKVYVVDDYAPNFSQYLPGEEEHILSMAFEGSLNQVLNSNSDYDLPEFMEKFSAVFQKYGVFYEHMESWNFTCYAM